MTVVLLCVLISIAFFSITFLLRLLDVESDKGNASPRPSHYNVSSNEASATFLDNLETEYSPDEAVSLSVFTEGIRNSWSEIEAIREKFIESYQPREREQKQ